MSTKRGNHFVLHMFQQDLENMKKWVLQYPNKETGGDLFGLWSGEGDNAVIHVVLGPGRDCTHGGYHFYQDVEYLKKVGNLLTEDYMLGHIGEWHSHHQLRLDEPSEGDCRTIQRNFPQGSCGFFLIIANIVDGDEVSFSPYIFKANSARFRAGYVEEMNVRSPFSLMRDISQKLEDGKEAEKEVASRNESQRDTHKQKSFLSNFKDMMINIIFGDEEPVESSRATSTTSTAYRVKIPSNSSLQWYSKKENHGIIRDIYHGLRERVGKTEITFNENDMKNMNMIFVYHIHEVSLSFPRGFPLYSATIMAKERNLGFVNLPKCYDILSFDLNEFLDAVFTILQTKLKDSS